ncbi:MAG: hypothetical protein GOMPHAMPRED_004745 [Gomphillus americanus]|uniref:Uncharacterized protein n=1 Tax=Gomphillus americanus TaxID=1940652 RepID=A0A8H3EJQ3_9LECA|nr:MAG: hypothetical protein GOMPHAMPRED_004745 [Gomphillus americanus]
MPVGVNGTARGGAAGRGRGGAARGAPRKKAGPRPARHVPWPEIFKHHISLVEGHLKMIDMVRKHTVEGSGNNRTIINLIDRAQNMLRDAKAVQREFVPPKDAWEKVPIGSSSATMYPGYSPKDHEYGKAAQEFGKQWSEARKKGIEFDTGPDGAEYQFGQSKASKKRRLNENGGVEGAANDVKSSGEEAGAKTAPAQTADDNPLFFFDSNPTPVKRSDKTTDTSQSGANSTSESEPASKKSKKLQNAEDSATATEHPKPVIEYENIDREVDARLKLKADAAKNNKDKKRKRGSAASTSILPEVDTSEETPPEKKAKSRKKKKDKAKPATEGHGESVDTEMEDLPLDSGDGKDAKTSNKDVNESSDTPKKPKKNKSSGNDVDSEHKKKKQKKNKSKD